jgi:hypothetical protein
MPGTGPPAIIQRENRVASVNIYEKRKPITTTSAIFLFLAEHILDCQRFDVSVQEFALWRSVISAM